MPMRVDLLFHPVFLFFRGHVIISTCFFALFQMLSGQLRKKCYRAMSGLIFSLEFSSNFRYNYASFCNVAVRFECRKKFWIVLLLCTICWNTFWMSIADEFSRGSSLTIHEMNTMGKSILNVGKFLRFLTPTPLCWQFFTTICQQIRPLLKMPTS